MTMICDTVYMLNDKITTATVTDTDATAAMASAVLDRLEAIKVIEAEFCFNWTLPQLRSLLVKGPAEMNETELASLGLATAVRDCGCLDESCIRIAVVCKTTKREVVATRGGREYRLYLYGI